MTAHEEVCGISFDRIAVYFHYVPYGRLTLRYGEKEAFINKHKNLLQSWRKVLSKVNPTSIRKGIRYIQRGGLSSISDKVLDYSERAVDEYDTLFRKEQEAKRAEDHPLDFSYTPLISVAVPTYNTPVDTLTEMLESLKTQYYPNWELCIADGSSEGNPCIDVLERYAKEDGRIKLMRLDKNYGISGNTNKALSLATGEYVALLDHDDFLEPDALYEIVKELQIERHDVLYTDEDKFDDEKKVFMDPHYKPDFNYDLLLCCNYITHFFVVKREISEKAGGLDSRYDGSQDYEFILKCTERASSVFHIRKILYHWRIIAGSTAMDPTNKLYCFEAGRSAVEAHLLRRGIEAKVTLAPNCWGYYHSTYPFQRALTTIVLGKEGNRELYLDEEVLYLPRGEDLVARLNDAVSHAAYDHILILEEGIYPADGKAVDELRSLVSRKDVAVAFPKITHDDKLLIAGVYFDEHDDPIYPYRGMDRSWEGYVRHLMVNRDVTIGNTRCFLFDRAKTDLRFQEDLPYDASVLDFFFAIRDRKKVFCGSSVFDSDKYRYETKLSSLRDSFLKKVPHPDKSGKVYRKYDNI